ncbi:hypothetical protein ATN88_06475 [Enterovibrio coralii]|uniref:Uncharacterized protein n=1 Tax=Enterovibrio coralii TaxID=294935 RepID=A0A135ID28_9GAMM|nr:hypothetical protein ATN88_06475 [Enterovibrio coralii]
MLRATFGWFFVALYPSPFPIVSRTVQFAYIALFASHLGDVSNIFNIHTQRINPLENFAMCLSLEVWTQTLSDVSIQNSRQ